MNTKTKKSQIQEVIQSLESISFQKEEVFKTLVRNEILDCKIKFPLLEYFTLEVAGLVPKSKQLNFIGWVVDQNYIGSYVIAGKFLQLRLSTDMEHSFLKAIDYFTQGDKWHCCDIISERVFGEGLLLDFEKAFSLLSDFIRHPNPWVRRGIGVSIHYATKRRVSIEKAQRLLSLTLTQIYDGHIEVKKGLGWGLKTLTKFHPEMVLKVKEQIEAPEVSRYYKTKMNTGLRLAEWRANGRD